MDLRPSERRRIRIFHLYSALRHNVDNQRRCQQWGYRSPRRRRTFSGICIPDGNRYIRDTEFHRDADDRI